MNREEAVARLKGAPAEVESGLAAIQAAQGSQQELEALEAYKEMQGKHLEAIKVLGGEAIKALG